MLSPRKVRRGDAVVVCCGPSIRGHDLRAVRRAPLVVGVNRAWEFLPVRFDAIVTIDTVRLRERAKGCPHPFIAAVPADYGTEAAEHACDREPRVETIRYLKRGQGEGFSDDKGVINSGLNSGFGALNWVYQQRPRRVFIFGLDASDMTDHFYGRASSAMPEHRAARIPHMFATALPQLQRAGIQVFNASPRSAVTAFPRIPVPTAVGMIKQTNPSFLEKAL